MLLGLIDCLVYATNWIIGSCAAGSGFIIWTVFFVVTYNETAPPIALAVPITNFAIGIWIIPFLLYWSERNARQNAFLRWCLDKVPLNVHFLGAQRLEEAAGHSSSWSADIPEERSGLREHVSTHFALRTRGG